MKNLVNTNMKYKKPSRFRGSLEVRHVSWWFIIPSAVLIMILRIIPSIIGIVYSFTDWNGLRFDPPFTGFQNYIDIFSDKTLRGSIINAIIICFAMVLFSNIFGLILAMCLQTKLKLRNVYRALFFIPFALSYLATGYAWQFILSYKGPFNKFLALFGVEPRAWLADPNWALVMIIIVLIWQYTGLTMVIYLAGLEGIPEEIHEACALDRAKGWRKFSKVIFPQLIPALVENLTLTLIWGLATFDQVISLTNGGPSGATETIASSTFKYTYQYSMYGRGSALAVILTILIAIFTILQRVLTRKAEESVS